MTDTIHCPDCGHPNPAGSESCEACNYPLVPEKPAAPPETRPATGVPMPPRRPRGPRPRPMARQSVGLWVLFGAIMAVILVFIAVNAYRERGQATPPVEGTNPDQQQLVDQFRHALEHDTTDVDARNGLADVLFDTGNWDEAIVHYGKVVAADSSRVGAIVDLGVCYYNTARSDEAERHFELALTRDPHHPVALFNLGIVNERRGDYEASLEYFHRVLEGGPPEHMRESLLQAMTRVLQKSGQDAPPLPEGSG